MGFDVLEGFLDMIDEDDFVQIEPALLESLIDGFGLFAANQDDGIRAVFHGGAEGFIELVLARTQIDHTRRYDVAVIGHHLQDFQ